MCFLSGYMCVIGGYKCVIATYITCIRGYKCVISGFVAIFGIKLNFYHNTYRTLINFRLYH